MIISELNYIESLDLQSAEISEVEGSSSLLGLLGLEGDNSIAEALASATAIGNNAIAVTETTTTAVPGGAASASSSLAISG